MKHLIAVSIDEVGYFSLLPLDSVNTRMNREELTTDECQFREPRKCRSVQGFRKEQETCGRLQYC